MKRIVSLRVEGASRGSWCSHLIEERSGKPPASVSDNAKVDFKRKIPAARAAAYVSAASRGMRRRSGARNSQSHSRHRNFLLFVRNIMIGSNPVGSARRRKTKEAHADWLQDHPALIKFTTGLARVRGKLVA
jgi:hypothetical protein